MARQDIRINVQYGEIDATNNLTQKQIHSFSLLPEMKGLDNDYFIYGEICLQSNYGLYNMDEKGVVLSIPYIPIYKELKVRLYKDQGNGSKAFYFNKTDSDIWFSVTLPEQEKIKASQFRSVNSDWWYNLVHVEGVFHIYSGYETDFVITPALNQNQNMLLKAFPGNLYQYPQTGVGLVNYLHGHLETSGLARKLQQEFNNDKMIINNAYMDSNTGDLLLDVEETDG